MINKMFILMFSFTMQSLFPSDLKVKRYEIFLLKNIVFNY